VLDIVCSRLTNQVVQRDSFAASGNNHESFSESINRLEQVLFEAIKSSLVAAQTQEYERLAKLLLRTNVIAALKKRVEESAKDATKSSLKFGAGAIRLVKRN
jgi:hypothetical protein